MTARCIADIAKGQIPSRITENCGGDFSAVKEDLNRYIDATGILMDEVGVVIRASREGRLSQRANPERTEGIYRKILLGVNDAFDAITVPLNAASRCVEHISKGQVPQKITEGYPGDLGGVKDGVNQYIDAMNALAADVAMLARAAAEGKLATRADASKHQGSFRKIVEDANGTLDAVIGPLNVAAHYIDDIAKGQTPPRITESYPGDFNTMKDSLNRCIDAISILVDEVGVVIRAGREGHLTQRANPDRTEGVYRKILRGVNDTLDAVVGPLNVAAHYVDNLSKGQVPQRITENYQGDFNKIKNNLNQCIDAVNALIADTAALSSAAAEGKLATRADASKHQGHFRKVIEDVNGTLDAVIGPLNVAAHYINDIAKGHTPPRITESYPGDFNTIKDNLNRCIDAIGILVDEVGVVIRAGREGHLTQRANADRTEGVYRKILRGVNDTLDAVVGPLDVAAHYVDNLSKGQVPQRITENYQGDFNKIKNSLNQCIDAVNALIADTAALSSAAAEGKFSVRADPSRHQGDFRKIVEGVNNTLDTLIAPVHDLAKVLDQLALGDLGARTDPSRYQNDSRSLLEGVNRTLDSLMAPVAEALQVLENLAKRDLSVRMSGAYHGDHAKMKHALNATAQALHEAMSQVSEAVGQVSSAAGQIAAASQGVATGASAQAASLQETASHLECMAGMTKQSADNSHQANALAQTARSAANEGAATMEQMTSAMAKIKVSAESTSQIIKDINEIAFQTNLLALNAAVEAARAGEAGRGFAVVAEEVRALALRSKDAAAKTEELIRQSVKEAGEGQATATEVRAKLTEIADSITKVSDIVAEIAAAAKEQAMGLDQVNKAVEQMDHVTQANAAGSEQSSSAAAELSGQSEELAAMVQSFRLGTTIGKPGAHQSGKKTGKAATTATGTTRGKNGTIPLSFDEISSGDHTLLKDL